MNDKFRNLGNQILDKLINCIGIVGILLILYGTFTNWFLSKWPPLEKLSLLLSVYVTLFATLFTAISIYFPVNNNNPKEFSKYVSAPVIIICILVAIFCAILNNGNLSSHILTGFSLLAMSGALFRLYGK